VHTPSLTVLPSSDPPFSRVGIAGLGLIGGSIALAARRAWPGVSVVGVDRADLLAGARERGFVDDTAESLSHLPPIDLLVLATPVSAIVSLLPEAARLQPAPLVTDVGSTKRAAMAAARRAGVARFIGGHPMAGSERGGLEQARPDLFDGRPWLLVDGATSPEAAHTLERFVTGLGARPRWIDPVTHDRAVAYLSHLPQILAVALMNAAAGALDDDCFAACGRAFDEMTRLAASPPGMWQEILRDNADFVSEALAAFAGGLPTRAQLADPAWLRDAFARAGASRARATAAASGTPPAR
jgi:prephenate dehydrogenase